MSEILAQISEKEILNRLKKFVPKNQIDNDTAKIDPLNKKLLINLDMMVEGIHFTEKTISAENIGWKGVIANFSDLASNGVDEIIGITVGLVAPPSTQWQWVEEVYEGMDKALKKYGGTLLGGDCSSSLGKKRILSITAIGTEGKINLGRGNASPGDYLVTSGPHGLSRLGLALLKEEGIEDIEKLSQSIINQAIIEHQKPHPPIKALRNLEKCKPASCKWVAGGTDSSDGLIEAIYNLCNTSQCKAILNLKNLPKHYDWPHGAKWDDWCMKGGEDFQLVLSLPPKWAENFVKIHTGSKIVGTIEKGPSIVVEKNSGKIINSQCEFNHFL